MRARRVSLQSEQGQCLVVPPLGLPLAAPGTTLRPKHAAIHFYLDVEFYGTIRLGK